MSWMQILVLHIPCASPSICIFSQLTDLQVCLGPERSPTPLSMHTFPLHFPQCVHAVWKVIACYSHLTAIFHHMISPGARALANVSVPMCRPVAMRVVSAATVRFILHTNRIADDNRARQI
jgi:hypothetical protein